MARASESSVAALSEEQVARAAKLSLGRLRSWNRRGLFRPDHITGQQGQPFARVYSFRDAVGLRALAKLADDYRVPISVLENVASGLQQRGFDHWADVKLCVVNGDVSFLDPETGQIEGVTTGQYAIVEIVDVISEVHDNIVKLRNRSPEDYGKFRNKRHVMRNSTVFSGTRIPISAVRRFLEAGYSSKEILKQYPSLTDADIQAVINQLDKTKLAG